MQRRAIEKLPSPIKEEIQTLVQATESAVVDVSNLDGQKKRGIGKHDWKYI